MTTVSATRSPEIRESPDNELRRFWPAVLACFCVAVFAWSFGFYGQSVFLAELHRMHGWPTAIISAATTWCYLAGAVFVLFVRRTLERVGPRTMLIGGTLLMGLGALGFSGAVAEWQLFVAALVMAAGWAATSTTAIATTLALWFDRRRGFAISLALNGASASGFTVAPLLVQASHAIGLSRTVLLCVLAGWIVVIPIVLACVGAKPTQSGGSTPRRDGSAMRSWHFWSVALPFALAIAAQVGFIVHMVAYLLPLLGRDGTSLAVIGSSLAAMLGRIGLGTIMDRLPARPTTALCFLSQAVGLGLLLVLPGDPAAICCGIVLFGLSVGNVITLPAVIVQAEFPAASFGQIMGLSGAISQFVLALSPGAFGLLHDAMGGYGGVLAVCIVSQIGGAAMLLGHRGHGVSLARVVPEDAIAERVSRRPVTARGGFR